LPIGLPIFGEIGAIVAGYRDDWTIKGCEDNWRINGRMIGGLDNWIIGFLEDWFLGGLDYWNWLIG